MTMVMYDVMNVLLRPTMTNAILYTDSLHKYSY